MKAIGDYIGGAFHEPEGEPLVSRNPARDGEPVLETAWTAARVAKATAAAAEAATDWAARSLDDRFAALGRFKDAIAESAEELADAIVLETGKLRSEARGEVSALLSRFDLIKSLVDEDLVSGPLPGRPSEQLRYHALGVVGVIGPFNYPMHLCHAHVIPALLLGNAVVVKPSEVTPLCGQRYAEAAHAAGLPAGVFNLVQGRGATGAALVASPEVRGVCFTGSYQVGRKIQEAALDRPELLVALEMGGKNTVVVLDDADLRQAAHEVAVGGYLTTGQRCTATDRVLVQRSCAGPLIDALRPLVEATRFGDPEDAASFAGPLATEDGARRFADAIEAARAAGAELIASGQPVDDGDRFYARASLHRLPDRLHDVAGYTDSELFGPDVHVEIVDDESEAIEVINKSPYGFANAVFTASSDRFERIYRETASGILNRNRSTNLASPRLPFGGVGKSGNYRPAGAHAPRNVVVPMAVQENVLGTVQVHPMLADALPDPDLDSLEARHAAEEAREADRSLLETPRPMKRRLPEGGRMPESDAWLTRLYAGDRVVREKKPAVFDHLRSVGPWFASIDDEPLCVMDGMSQTATLCGGFAEDPVVRAYVEGGFTGTLVSTTDTSARETEVARAYANTLRHLVPGLPQVSFVNSGAEANEKALALCKQNADRPGASKVLAFEGSFHGRTLWSLHATYNPSKREPFQIAGHEVSFVPFPVWDQPGEEPAAPSGFYAHAGLGEIDELERRFGDPAENALLAAEVASLAAVDRALKSGDFFACIVEPMQSEGGDRYASARFFRALRLLTRHHAVHLIFDEVQTGFGLGGSFAWHSKFRLVNFRGQPDYPDAVSFAKRAQVGAVMSRFEDPEPSSSHPASLVRGRLHAEMMTTSFDAERIEKLVTGPLTNLAVAFPHLVGNPRAKGYAFAFDLPTSDHLKAYLGQRFWRGAIVFGAGSKTVRYRLSEGFHAREVEELFETVRRSLSWLDAHPGQTPPSWENTPQPERPRRGRNDVVISTIDTESALSSLPQILDIEYMVYEPARRTPPGQIRAAIEQPDSIVTFAEVPDGDDWQLIGFAIGAPLEACVDEEGPDRDPMLGKNNTLYSVSVTVAEEYQGMGIGRELKLAQLREAAARKTADGRPRYRYVSSRNRVGMTASMRHLNRVYGAHTVTVLTGQYEDPEGQALYSRTPLPPYAPEVSAEPKSELAELSDGISRPLAEPPESLVAARDRGLLWGPAINKLTIMNYATPAMVRALEWVGALLPELPHLYLTSSRDECVDKSLRILRWHRKEAQVAIGFEGGYVGHTTGAARSISDPGTHRQGPGPFDWPRVPHPAVAGTDASIAALRSICQERGSSGILGLLYEPVQERTGQIFPADFWPLLDQLRAEFDLPLVAVETASACYRSGPRALFSSRAAVRPDLVVWWGGAHTGYLHVSSRYRVPTPLTMVSTWDGDELSLIREHHQLRAARKIDRDAGIAALDRALASARELGVESAGLGLYRVLSAGDRAAAIASGLAERGLRIRELPGGRLPLSPPLDRATELADRLATALREIL